MSEILDIQAIRHLLPHRYPFLLIDRVTAYEPGQRAEAIKNVTINEPFFQGHFPTQPIMPGVLIVEAMAQLGGVLLMQRTPLGDKLALLTGIDRVRFRRQVVPGDQLLLTAEILKIHGNMGKVKVSAQVNQEAVSEGELMFYLAEAAGA
jgi:3-hydroxyacyl-[acyl-carrier-protein] dehydratase